MRLVDIDNLLEQMVGDGIHRLSRAQLELWSEESEEPDAVIVTRCEDCKSHVHCAAVEWCTMHQRSVHGTDFCSYARRAK